jgi:hypothetical protein
MRVRFGQMPSKLENFRECVDNANQALCNLALKF